MSLCAQDKPRKFEVTGYHTSGYAGTNDNEWWQNDRSKLTVRAPTLAAPARHTALPRRAVGRAAQTVADFCGVPAGKAAEFHGLRCEAYTRGVHVREAGVRAVHTRNMRELWVRVSHDDYNMLYWPACVGLAKGVARVLAGCRGVRTACQSNKNPHRSGHPTALR